ncbi:MAG: hypothetical protein RR502_03700 [Oscillospiraceae bacterium]
MKFFTSLKGAVTVTLLVALVMIPVGTHRSLVRERKPADEALVAMTVTMDKTATLAANVQAVLERNLPQSVSELQGAVNHYTSASAATRLDSWENLTLSLTDALAELESANLSEKDAGYVRDFSVEVASQMAIVSHCAYESLAAAYNSDVLGGFPANVLGKLTGITPLPTLT